MPCGGGTLCWKKLSNTKSETPGKVSNPWVSDFKIVDVRSRWTSRHDENATRYPVFPPSMVVVWVLKERYRLWDVISKICLGINRTKLQQKRHTQFFLMNFHGNTPKIPNGFDFVFFFVFLQSISMIITSHCLFNPPSFQINIASCTTCCTPLWRIGNPSCAPRFPSVQAKITKYYEKLPALI